MNIKEYNIYLDDKQHPFLKTIRECDCIKEAFTTPKDIADELIKMYDLDKKAEESVIMLALNTKCKPLGVFEVFKGTINGCIFNPREILIRAMLVGAAHIVCIHNHPSGVLKPSKEDENVSKRLYAACEMVGIPLLDFIIVKNGYFSFKEADKI